MRFKDYLYSSAILWLLIVTIFLGATILADPLPVHAVACPAGDDPTFTHDIQLKGGTAFTQTMTAPRLTGNRILNLPDWDTVSTGVARKTVSENKNTDIVIAVDSELQFPGAANANYVIEGTILIVSDSTPDIIYGIELPTGATAIWRTNKDSDNAALDETDTEALVIPDTDTYLLDFSAYVTMGSTAGTVGFEWAQETSSGSTTTVRLGSLLRYWQD